MYDPAKNEWKMMGSMTVPRSNAGFATVGNTIYAVGGFDGNEFLNTAEVYNLESNEWSAYTKIYKFWLNTLLLKTNRLSDVIVLVDVYMWIEGGEG